MDSQFGGLSVSRGDLSLRWDTRFEQQPAASQALPDMRAARFEVPIDELTFCPVRTSREIAYIRHLRTEIQLPASAVADPAFVAREKKETRRASSALSSGVTRASAP